MVDVIKFSSKQLAQFLIPSNELNAYSGSRVCGNTNPPLLTGILLVFSRFYCEVAELLLFYACFVSRTPRLFSAFPSTPFKFASFVTFRDVFACVLCLKAGFR